MNHALEKQGLHVIETDLGEYIVQLRGEAPSHIITPAVHLRRQDVGKLFEEKLGLPYTEDINVYDQCRPAYTTPGIFGGGNWYLGGQLWGG